MYGGNTESIHRIWPILQQYLSTKLYKTIRTGAQRAIICYNQVILQPSRSHCSSLVLHRDLHRSAPDPQVDGRRPQNITR